MKTVFYKSRGYIALVIRQPGYNEHGKQAVLAAMTLMEGTRCWMLTDIRLKERPIAHAYSGSVGADDALATFMPKDQQERRLVLEMLRDYTEMPDGLIVWCPYGHLVKGASGVDGYNPPTYRDLPQPIYHSFKDCKAWLSNARSFWEAYEGTIIDAKLENPYRQPTDTEVSSRLMVKMILKNMALP